MKPEPWAAGREQPVAPAVLDLLTERQQEMGAWADPEDFEKLEPSSFPALSLVEVRELPPLERLVVLGVFWGNLPLTDVAEVLQRDNRTVTKTFRRALDRLREMILQRAGERSTADAVEP